MKSALKGMRKGSTPGMTEKRPTAIQIVDGLFSVRKLAKYIDLKNYRTIYNWLQSGKGPEPKKMNGSKRELRWRKADVDAWLEQQEGYWE